MKKQFSKTKGQFQIFEIYNLIKYICFNFSNAPQIKICEISARKLQRQCPAKNRNPLKITSANKTHKTQQSINLMATSELYLRHVTASNALAIALRFISMWKFIYMQKQNAIQNVQIFFAPYPLHSFC